MKTSGYYIERFFSFHSFTLFEIIDQLNPKPVNNVIKNIFYQRCLTWPLWTWRKTITLICLFSNQIFLPAFVFMGLEQGDCCGCGGNENCGKRCAVGPPLWWWKTASMTSPWHCGSLPVFLLSLDAFLYTGCCHRNCRIWLLRHCGSPGLSGRTTLSWFIRPVELYLCQHRGTVSNCSPTDHTFFSTTCV